ncbi:ABC transporter substrate-binding protein [Oribacterium sp. WCC10]|uniref:ABC transporter substrate-binding protein n=1 Tax=Oribacterium sp. WCC10 TaxID=1855343 RepID=UPI0008E73CE4|nr:ABC transporter substrate-binding protein [Oribacterium sp. WCC10]SFG53860.1 oligogalacturonide transport system substrate-binding protein [Oribacterium sp. WCC10]
MRKMVTKILSGSLAASMVMGLAACGGSSTAPTEAAKAEATTAATTAAETVANAAAENGGDVNLRISWWGGDSRHNATLKMLDEYMAANPNVKVESEYGAWSGWQDKIATQIAGNSEPDLFQINWNWLWQFSADGTRFADLKDLTDFDLSQYDQSLLDLMTIDGHVLGVPVSSTGRVFYWNKATFEKAGLEVPTSFADILAAGPVFKEKLGDDYYPLAAGTYDLVILLTYYMQEKYNKQWVVDGQLNYTVDELADGFDFLKSLEENHVIPTQEKLTGDGADSLDKNPNFIDGHYAGLVEWDSSIKKLVDALDSDQELVIGEYPADYGTPATVYKVSMGFAISPNSANKEEAAKLLQYMFNGDGVETLALERGVPASKAAQEKLSASGALSGLTYEANQAASANAPFQLSPYYEDAALKDSAEGAYQEIMNDMSYDGVDSKELAQSLIDAVNEVESK